MRNQLLYDLDDQMVQQRSRLSRRALAGGHPHRLAGRLRADAGHTSEELRRFIRPGKTKWGFWLGASDGLHVRQGRGAGAALQQKLETKEKANDAYAALLTARCGEAYDPSQDVWRLEFQLKREGPKGSGSMPHPKRKTTMPKSRRNWPPRNCSTSARCRASSPAWMNS